MEVTKKGTIGIGLCIAGGIILTWFVVAFFLVSLSMLGIR